VFSYKAIQEHQTISLICKPLCRRGETDNKQEKKDFFYEIHQDTQKERTTEE